MLLLLLLLLLPCTLEYNLRGTPRRRESFISSSFPLLRDHFVDAVCRHRAAHNYGMGSGLPEQNSFVFYSGEIHPVDGVLTRFPLAVVLFSASRSPRKVLFHLDCLPKGFRGVKKMVCLPSLLSGPPAMSPDLRIEATS